VLLFSFSFLSFLNWFSVFFFKRKFTAFRIVSRKTLINCIIYFRKHFHFFFNHVKNILKKILFYFQAKIYLPSVTHAVRKTLVYTQIGVVQKIKCLLQATVMYKGKKRRELEKHCAKQQKKSVNLCWLIRKLFKHLFLHFFFIFY